MRTATPPGAYPSYVIVSQSEPPAVAPDPRLTALSMLLLGTEDFLAFWIASYSVGLPEMSPPPERAATSMFLMSLAKSLPRLASIAAFLCLVVAHLAWPLMNAPSDSVPGGGGVRRTRLDRHPPRGPPRRGPLPRGVDPTRAGPESPTRRGAPSGRPRSLPPAGGLHHVDEQPVQPVVAGDLGVERGDQQRALAGGHDAAGGGAGLDAGQHLDGGAGLLHPGGADEDGPHRLAAHLAGG